MKKVAGRDGIAIAPTCVRDRILTGVTWGMSERNERLFRFFAGYFNQDWDCNGAISWPGVMDEYLSQNRREDALQTRDDLRSWLAESVTEERVPAAFGSEYDPSPDGMTDRAWVGALADYIEERVGV